MATEDLTQVQQVHHHNSHLPLIPLALCLLGPQLSDIHHIKKEVTHLAF